jgi:vacuolar-type H+-ATPase subunit D/Vma8
MREAIRRWFGRGKRVRKLEAQRALLKKQRDAFKRERDNLIGQVLSLQNEISSLKKRLQHSYRDVLDKMFEELRRFGNDK